MRVSYVNPFKKVIACLLMLIILIMCMGNQSASNQKSVNKESFISITAGYRFSIALKSDGTVWAWGNNDYGQLGNGTKNDSLIPVQIFGLPKIKAIASGYRHSLALGIDGTVWAWGYNEDGELGDGSRTLKTKPVKVKSLSGISQIISGSYHSVAIKNDGSIWGWGDNEYKKLGAGNEKNYNSPIKMPEIKGILSVAAGEMCTAILDSTTLRVYGRISYLQKDNFDCEITDAKKIAVCRKAIWVLKSDGNIFRATDTTINNQDGNMHLNEKTIFNKVQELNNITDISAFDDCALMLNDEGKVMSSGYLYSTVNGDITYSAEFGINKMNISQVKAIAVGGHHVLFLKNDGSIWTLGSNDYGQIGDGTRSLKPHPIKVTGLSDVLCVSAGVNHTLALKKDGTVYSFGRNNCGQLGCNTYKDSYKVQKVIGISDVKCISAGGSSSMALKKDGTVWIWGKNNNGELGNETVENSPIPIEVQGLNDVVYIDAGISYSLAIKKDGTVWAWGDNSTGMLRRVYFSKPKFPVQIVGFSNAIKVIALENRIISLGKDGKITVAGYSAFDGFKNEYEDDQTFIPTIIDMKKTFSDIKLGGYHILGLMKDGSLWAWGGNSAGQLGTGSLKSSTTPVSIKKMTDVILIDAEQYYSLAVKKDGTVWQWGRLLVPDDVDKGDGQLTPKRVSNLSNIINISVSDSFAVAVNAGGTVYAWGNNYYGQLGNPDIDRRLPTKVVYK